MWITCKSLSIAIGVSLILLSPCLSMDKDLSFRDSFYTVFSSEDGGFPPPLTTRTSSHPEPSPSKKNSLLSRPVYVDPTKPLYVLAVGPHLEEIANKNYELAKKASNCARQAAERLKALVRTARTRGFPIPESDLQHSINEIVFFEVSENNASFPYDLPDLHPLTDPIKSLLDTATQAIGEAQKSLTLSKDATREMREKLCGETLNLTTGDSSRAVSKKSAKSIREKVPDEVLTIGTSSLAISEGSEDVRETLRAETLTPATWDSFLKNIQEKTIPEALQLADSACQKAEKCHKKAKAASKFAENSVATMRYLMKQETIPNPNTPGLSSPLHIAVETHSTDFVKEFIQYSEVVLDAKDEKGDTPLHLAASLGYTDIVEILLTQDPALRDIQNAEGNTPAHCAVQNAHLHLIQWEIMKLLGIFGANLTLRNNDALRPLDVIAQIIERRKINEGGMKKGQEDTEEASQSKRLRKMHNIISIFTPWEEGDYKDAPLDLISRIGKEDTPVHLAAFLGYTDIVGILLKKNSSFLEAVNQEGETPIFAAIDGGHLDTVKFLIKYKVNLTHTNRAGQTPHEKAKMLKDSRENRHAIVNCIFKAMFDKKI